MLELSLWYRDGSYTVCEVCHVELVDGVLIYRNVDAPLTASFVPISGLWKWDFAPCPAVPLEKMSLKPHEDPENPPWWL